MTKFYLFFIFIIIGAALWNIFLFVDLRLKIKQKKYEIIKLKKVVWADFIITILLGLLASLIIYYNINKVSNDYLFFIFESLLILAMISRLLVSGEYILINVNGIKYGKLIKWDSIIMIKRNEYKSTEIIIDYNSKKEIIDFYSEDKINELKLIVSRISPDIYDSYLTGL